ncbi:MAG: hypothetical protein BGO67_06600 [Alphaproteobacteria bacterium 41-28]|nr:MAG: hypothetical protein BGO67_06600 [Alphaproteobacteria bacterium 41-28]
MATVCLAAASTETLLPGCPKAFQGFGLKDIIGYDVGFGKRNDVFTRRSFASNGTLISSEFNGSRTDLGLVFCK